MTLLKYVVTFVFIKQCFSAEIIKINLQQGTVVGKIEQTLFKKQDYYTFKGIPFAAKPTGELRFQPPQPHEGWDGTLEAFENKPTCMQFSSRMRLGDRFGISGSEDCLFISVFTPNVKGNAPVIVFDYNDYFSTWFNGTDTFSPDFLVEEGLIVVTISHRLGILGYLTTENGVIPANNGLRDYIFGLEWVKNNIENFGGDASKVTLMGSKGGAAIANILLYSKKATGLFSGAILQSGTALEPMYFYDKPKYKAFQLGEALNITATNSEELLKGLLQIDAEKLVYSEINILDDGYYGTYQRNVRPFTPTIEYDAEDGLITQLPENGQIVNDVPIIIGVNSREGLDLISHLIFEPNLVTHSLEESLLQFPVRSNFRFDPKSSKYKEATREIVNYYFEDKSLHYGNILEHAVYVEDIVQNYAIDLAAITFSKSLTSPVFYYKFDYKGEWNINTQYLMTRCRSSIGNTGATIIDELCYLLVCTPMKKTYEDFFAMASEQKEVKVMKKMVRMWSNFAKTRNPTPSKEDNELKGFIWEPFTTEADNYLHINKNLKMKTSPLGDRRKFWNDFLEKYSKMAKDGVVTDYDASNVKSQRHINDENIQKNDEEAIYKKEVYANVNKDYDFDTDNDQDNFDTDNIQENVVTNKENGIPINTDAASEIKVVYSREEL